MVVQIANTAEVTINENDTDPSNDTDDATVIVNAADLRLSKTISTTTPQVGDEITYVVTVTNDGPNDATGVTVEDTLPPAVTFVSAITIARELSMRRAHRRCGRLATLPTGTR